MIAVRVPPRPTSQNEPVAYCLEPHDLVLAKCVAGRDRDWAFAVVAIGAGIVTAEILLGRIDDLPGDPPHRSLLKQRLEALL